MIKLKEIIVVIMLINIYNILVDAGRISIQLNVTKNLIFLYILINDGVES